LCRVHRPGGVARGQLERSRILTLGLHPELGAFGEAQFRELAAEKRFELCAQSITVEAVGLVGAIFLGSATLHEQPLHLVERRQRIVAQSQRPHLVGDAEQLGDEVLELGRKLDDEIGFGLACRRFWGRARRHQPMVQVAIARLEHVDEAGVEAHQAVAAIEFLEAKAETERQALGHRERRPRRGDMRPTASGLPDLRSGICCTISSLYAAT
jgi:hypothetical protein